MEADGHGCAELFAWN